MIGLNWILYLHPPDHFIPRISLYSMYPWLAFLFGQVRHVLSFHSSLSKGICKGKVMQPHAFGKC